MPATPTGRASLRLWPGLVLAALLIALRYLSLLLFRDAFGGAILAGAALSLGIVVWWLAFSRAPWRERLAAIVLMPLLVAVAFPLVHASIAGGMMGMMLPMYAVPLMCLALVAWAAIAYNSSTPFRFGSLAVAFALATAAMTVVRTDGIFGESGSQLAWRWTPTAEQKLIASTRDEPAPLPTESAAPAAEPASAPAASPASSPSASPAPEATTASETKIAASPVPATDVAAAAPPREAEWPGFRGPRRDGVVDGLRIATDWAATPPTQIWRRPIGPGWSSFAVRGDLFYTQEQRGEEEIVAAYRVSTGEPVWRHRDPVRFWESNGGAGPRATPTIAGDRVYAFGATGILNALDAATGRRLWSANVGSDTGRRVPDWGFASSPLVINGIVVVAASGTLAGYAERTGKLQWVGPSHGGSYSSPQRMTIDGVSQVVLLHGSGATSVDPASGKLLWEHAWDGSAIVQPAVMPDGDVVINSVGGTGGLGTRRLAIVHNADGWKADEKWTSSGLKPYFNDFVLHGGYAYGFDGSILACIDLADGQRKWKGGRYGSGQLLLLADEDLLLVLSEEGEIALVKASPERFEEVARMPGIEGKTWNHPAIAGDVLLVRNGEEMAAFRLKVQKP